MKTLQPAFQALANSEVLQLAHETASGAEIHLVGGALRDCYLGLASPDLDLVVAGDGRDFSARLARRLQARLVRLGGNRFAAYRLVRGDLFIDVWDRQESSLLSDLERRDFSINAIALDLNEGTLCDPFHGLRDLETRLLRVVIESSLCSDPLRVLRLVRLALALPGFSVDPHTRDLARAAAPKLATVAAERTREELTRILRDGKPTQAFDLLLGLQVFEQLWGCEETENANLERLAPTLFAYERVEAICQTLSGRLPNRLLCVHTLISYALPPPGTGAEPPRGQLITGTQARAIASLLTVDAKDLGADPRPFLARWGDSWLEAAALSASLADATDEPLSTWLEQLVILVETEGQDVLHPQPLLNGDEIQKLLDLPPGPAIGDLLKKLLDAQVRGEVKDRTEAAELVARARESTENV